MDKIVNNLILELHVPNFDKERQFYAIFGFKQIKYDPTSGGGSTMGYMILKKEDSLGETHINFYGDDERVVEHAHFADFPDNTPRGYAVEITIPVANVRALWGDVKDKLEPLQIAQPLKLKRWGKEDFRVIDPFGFYVRFTEVVDWY